MGNTIETRPLRPGEEKHCLELYNEVHPVGMSLDSWRWRNTMNPRGSAMIETAWDRDKLVGFYGITPRKLIMGGKEFMGALSDLALTHPEYRYQGIFTALGKGLYQRAENTGIAMIYGFPTEHNRHAFERALSWEYVLQCSELCCWRYRGDRQGMLSVDPVDSLDSDKLDFLFQMQVKQRLGSDMMVARDTTYLNWRFFRHPEYRYCVFVAQDSTGPQGYMAVRERTERGEKVCDIVDVMAVNIRIFRELIGFIYQFIENSGCLTLRLPVGSPYFQSAKGLGFRETAVKYFFGIKKMEGFSSSIGEWYYTMGDSHER